MNISLSGAGKKKKGSSSSLGFGLNKRSDNKSSGGTSKNVFGDDDADDSDGDDNEETVSGRQAVNQQIAKEQAALRKRAQAALATAEDPSMYDYDGAYDSFKQEPEKEKASTDGSKERKSKYIGDLLKAAKVRERERDAIHERKIAREQAEEDAQEEYAGKEKFVTKAYKRKLEERKQWEMEQEEKQREEDENDVTKKSAGAAFAGFYGNFNKNVSVGGQGEEEEKTVEKDDSTGKGMDSLDDFDPRKGFLGDFEHSKAEDDGGAESGAMNDSSRKEESSSAPPPPPVPAMTMRERREKKVAEARIRYLKRKEAAAMNQ